MRPVIIIFFALLTVGLNAQTIEFGLRHNNSGTDNLNRKIGLYGQLGYFIDKNIQVAFQIDRIEAENSSTFYPKYVVTINYPYQHTDTVNNVTYKNKVWVNNFCLKLKFYKEFSKTFTCNIGPSVGFSFFHNNQEYQNYRPNVSTTFSAINLGLDLGLNYPLIKSKRLSAALNVNPGIILSKKANYNIDGYSGMNHSYTQLRLGLMWNFGKISD